MKSVEQYKRWLQAKLDWLEEFPSHNMSPMDWVEAREIVDEAKEFAYQLRIEFPPNPTDPPRRQLLELLNFIDQPSDDALIGLAAAAELLGYSKSGLRKIVRQNRIQHFQNGTGPIKFRREWLNDFKSAPSPTKATPTTKTRKFEPTHLKRPGT